MARYLSLALFLLYCCAAGNAMAHGGLPAAQSIHVFDDDWVLVTNFGAMTSTHPEHYTCEEAFFGNDRFDVAPLAVNEWVTFTRSTVARTTDGCTFERVHDLPDVPTDVAALPESDELAYTVQNEGVAEIWHSQDRGITWTMLSEDLTGIRPSSIGFLGPQHLIVVGYITEEDLRGAPLILDLNLNTDERIDHRPDDELRFPNLLDARNGNFLWHARRDDINEIFWSRPDDLQYGFFAVARWPNSGAISHDGTRAYLGGVNDSDRGVFSATAEDPEVWTEEVVDHSALCLAADANGFFLCGQRNLNHDLSYFNLDNQSEELVDFRNLQGPRTDCPAESDLATTCPAVWSSLARALGIAEPDNPDNPDYPDNPDDSDPNNPDLDDNTESETSTCSTTPQRPSPEFLLLMLSAALVISQRHNRSAAPRRGPENS